MAAFFTACGDDNDDLLVDTTPKPTSPDNPIRNVSRTVMVYMAADNSLTGYASSDLAEMATGSLGLTPDCKLVALVDRKGEKPYIAELQNGEIKKLAYEPQTDYSTADPQKMEQALRWIISSYQSESYALVLWGHASGWYIENDTITRSPRRAYGQDTTGGTSWINIPTLAKTLEALPVHFDFIFADCCNMMSAEVAYELRHSADWLIGSPAEIPGVGAPYDKITPKLFKQGSGAFQDIIDTYAENHPVPLAAANLKEMDAFAEATAQITGTLNMRELDANSVAYYHKRNSQPMFYDMRDMFQHADIPAAAYTAWETQLLRTVPYRHVSSRWDTVLEIYFSSFSLTDDNYGGMSMHFPLARYDGMTINEDVKRMSWWWRINN